MLNRDTSPVLHHWSTDAIPQEQRCDCFIEALSSAVIPIDVTVDDPDTFSFKMSMTDLTDGISVLHQTGSGHHSARGRQELARSGEHTFHFLVNLASDWKLEHCGASRVVAGQGVLTDSRYTHDLTIPEGFDFIHVKMSAAWLRRWVGSADILLGQPIPLDSGFGRALNLFTAQLTPEGVVEASLHGEMLADQFGALVAMVAGERGGMAGRWRGELRTLCDQIRVCMTQRSADPGLDVSDVAADLHVSEIIIHDALASCGYCFSDVLSGIRLKAAVRMLASRSFRQFSIAEIGLRAGYHNTLALIHALRIWDGTTGRETALAHAVQERLVAARLDREPG